MPEELKPCPFCGGNPRLVYAATTAVFVACSKCFSNGPTSESKDDATDAWNRSALPSPSPIADRLATALRQCLRHETIEHPGVAKELDAALAGYEKSKGEAAPAYDLVAHIVWQREFSEKTFGPGARTAGVINHIRNELFEIEAEPFEIEEWIDVVLLALDGAWRAGHEPQAIAEALRDKQEKNMARQWPDWRTVPSDKAIEHVREEASKGGEKT